MHRYRYPETCVTAQALKMVTEAEMKDLAESLSRGQIPADLAAKLGRLRTDNPRELYLRQQALILEWLLTSPAALAYCRIGPREAERLLRTLAYVRKDDDAIPDTWVGGMTDDHDLMRMTCVEYREVLDTFKAWRLSHQVPVLWHGTPARLHCAPSVQDPG